jgi:hypothetical protein
VLFEPSKFRPDQRVCPLPECQRRRRTEYHRHKTADKPQVWADQMGHGVDVNQNDYTKASLERRKAAVNALERAVGLDVM